MRFGRWVAALLAAATLTGAVGCGPTVNSQSRAGNENFPPPPPQPQQGMSTRNKVLLVAGAAALYYLYKRHQNAQGEGVNGRYYRSKNGRIYYRDMKTGAYHWVDPPQQPIQVPADEYERYTGQRVNPGYGGQVIRDVPTGAAY